MIRHEFSNDEIKLCKEFSDQVDTSLYAQRKQTNADKRKRDSYIGKLGEVAVYEVLKTKFPNLSYPDTKIYSAKEKSWDFDLKDEGVNLHVKSQDVLIGEKYGTSWIFQYGDGEKRHYDREIFDKITPNQYVAFVSINLDESCALVRGIVKLDFLHEKKLFAAPKLDILKIANKLAVYLKDLERYPECLNELM